MTGAQAGASTDEIAGPARSILDTVVASLPRLWIALLLVVAGWALSRLVRWLLHRSLRRRQTPSFARVMSRLGGWLVLFLQAAPSFRAAVQGDAALTPGGAVRPESDPGQGSDAVHGSGPGTGDTVDGRPGS